VSDVSRLHNWHHDDYEEAKREIYAQLGSLDGMHLFGRKVLVAVYIRPQRSSRGLYQTVKAQKEDIYQGKAVLLVKAGPDAFSGDEAYLASMYGPGGAPKLDEWLFLNSNQGVAVNWEGDGATKLTFVDDEGRMQDRFEWAAGWPCRVVEDDCFMGRMTTPHSAV
jgi:hypothetical protein